jgi:chromosomal replication initiation ATPase DnaA
MTRDLTLADVARLRGIFDRLEATEGRDAAIREVVTLSRALLSEKITRVDAVVSAEVRAGINALIDETAKVYGIDRNVVRGPARFYRAVRAREEAMWRVSRCNLSLRAVGSFFGGRHHATVICALERFEDRLKVEPETRARLGLVDATVAAIDGRRAA